MRAFPEVEVANPTNPSQLRALNLDPPDVRDDLVVMPVVDAGEGEPLARGKAAQHGVAPNVGIAGKVRKFRMEFFRQPSDGVVPIQ